MNSSQNPFEAIDTRFNSLESLVLDIKELLANKSSTPSTNDDEILTVRQASTLLNLAVPTIYALTSSRTLPHSKRGKKLYFRKNELLAWIQSGRRNTSQEIKAKASSK